MGTKLMILLSFSLLLFGANCYSRNPEKEGHEEEEEESPEETLFKCLMSCEKQKKNERELSPCEEICVREYKDAKRQQQPGTFLFTKTTINPKNNTKGAKANVQYKNMDNKGNIASKNANGNTRNRKENMKGMEKEMKRSTPRRNLKGKMIVIIPTSSTQGLSPSTKLEKATSKFLKGFLTSQSSSKGSKITVWPFLRQILIPSSFLIIVMPNQFLLLLERYSFNLKQGDVMRVPSGSLMYLVNQDDNERLYVLKLLQPVNTPGRFKEYFGVGTDSFFRTFSSEILEAAFNSPSERLEKFFGQQKQGVIIKASKEQIRSLSQESESTTSEDSWEPFNLLDQQPLFSSNYGHYFEASPIDHRQLKDLDVSIGFMNIKSGGMVAPYYNSRSTKLVFVVGGNGQYEMACPHLSDQSKHNSQGQKEKQTGVHYERVSARLSIGDAFVIPAGHPIAILASQDSNLQLASFGIKGSFDQKHFLAGQENIWNEVEPEAKELAFKMQAREVEDIFRSQEVSYFLPGPRHHEQKGKGQYVASIWDFVGFG
ncbi:vicilin-like protein [Striga asiatica]|uniref:Vicilin-like protein n=1 Tax=Striga asiatica TaxID=4170 RepID=A0A5A7PNC3_STRAF|nr:vicilin-like protein [Striga asiatica]